MDNVTHSLFGYALGRACTSRAVPAPARDRALVATSVVASNAPDLDFVTGLFGDDRRLLYLLDHRGFTHTVLFAVVIGAATGYLCCLASKLTDARDRLAAAALGAGACILHVACDFLNDYGVHPFFPFDNRWYYGDAVFIIEPLWIAVLAPLPLWFAWRRAGRALAGVVLLGLLALVWFAGMPPLRALMVTAVSIAAALVQRRLGPRAWPPLAASAIVIATFAAGGRLAEARVHSVLGELRPSEHVIDIASIPAPADPTCYRALVLTLDPQRTYRARFARVQLFGEPAACELLPSTPTAPLRAAGLPVRSGVGFDTVFTAPAAELAQLAAAQCDAAAMLRFVRAPYWQTRADGTVLGDLRYDRAPTLEFAERLLRGACGAARGPFAPWVPPREDLLSFPPR